MVDAGRRGPQKLKSLDLALRLLGVFGEDRPERGVTDLAKELGVSKAAVYRVLTTLEHHQYIRQNPRSRLYGLGSRLIRMGDLAAKSFDLREAARPFMENLRHLAGETTELAVLDGAEIVYIEKLDSPHPVRVVSSIGARAPAHCTSSGKVLLAHAGAEYVERLVAKGLKSYTELTRCKPAPLAKELARVRRNGYAVNWGEYREEVRGIAAPVMNATDRVVASINVCAPASRLTKEKIASLIPLVVETAGDLSQRLGVSPEEPEETPEVSDRTSPRRSPPPSARPRP